MKLFYSKCKSLRDFKNVVICKCEKDQNTPAGLYHFTEHGRFQWHTRCIFNNRAFKTHIQFIRHGNRCGNCAVIFSVIELVSPVIVLPSVRRTADLNYRLVLSYLVSLFQNKPLFKASRKKIWLILTQMWKPTQVFSDQNVEMQPILLQLHLINL